MSSITMQEAKNNLSSIFDRVRQEGIMLIKDGSSEFMISYTENVNDSSPFEGVKSVVSLKESDVNAILREAKEDRKVIFSN